MRRLVILFLDLIIRKMKNLKFKIAYRTKYNLY